MTSTEDALLFLVKYLRREVEQGGYAQYGYELYLPNVVRSYSRYDLGVDLSSGSVEERELSKPFLDAAWELCRRGILRPGVRTFHAQATSDGSAGSGFSITQFGTTWLGEPEHDTFVPTEPERFAQLLANYRDTFGAGFHERAQQALRCYGAHAYLACCAMCGAAAESILLAAAGRKLGKEAAEKTYVTASGRSRLEKALLGQVDDRLRRELQAFASLLKYWRDASAHGRASAIADNEAFTSIALLLRLAASMQSNWEVLTSGSSGQAPY